MTDQSGESSVRRDVVFEIKEMDTALHQAPTIHVDGAQSIIANEYVVKFNLFQDRLVGSAGKDSQVPIERVICARLVMSPVVFKQIADWMGKYTLTMFPPTEGS